MSDTSTMPSTPFTIGDTLHSAAGETKITRDQAAAVLAEQLRAAGATSEANRAGTKDKGGFAGFVQGAVQGVDATLGRVPDVGTGIIHAGVDAFAGRNKSNDKYDKLAKKLAALLPDEALYSSVVSRLDTRQILSHVMVGSTTQAKSIGGVNFSAAERTLAGRVFETQQAEARSSATALAQLQGITGDAAVKKYVDDAVKSYRDQPTVLGVSPVQLANDAVSASGTPGGAAAIAAGAKQSGSSASSFQEFLGNYTAGNATGAAPVLTDADVQAMFRLAGTDLSATNAYVGAVSDIRGVDPSYKESFNVQTGVNPVTGLDPSTYTDVSHPPERHDADVATSVLLERNFQNGRDTSIGKRGYTVTQTKDMLYGMSKEEVAKMQTLLMRAGYFAGPDGKSTEPLYRGDATDDQTQAAWLHLLGDSIRSGKPLFDVLTGKVAEAGNKFATVDGKIAPKDVVLTDTAAIQQGSDDIGVKTIGRKLSDDEHAKVVEFIHKLESTSQTTAAGAGSQTVENPDVQAEITKYIQTQFPTETAGKEVAGTYDMFTQLLRGPGGR